MPEADDQSITRYLYLAEDLGIQDEALKLELGGRLVGHVKNPQHCSNAALALARQEVQAEEVVQKLVSKMVTLD